MGPTFFENEYISVTLEDGIIIAIYKPNLKIDLKVAKATVEARKVISNGNVFPGLADIRNLKSITDEARDWLGTKEPNELLSSCAVLTNNPIQNLLANFYLKFSKPPIPTKLFTDKSKAIRWLRLYLQRN
jgi:hypothetical protein